MIGEIIDRAVGARQRRRLTVPLAILGCLALLASGCGSSKSTSGGASGSPSAPASTLTIGIGQDLGTLDIRKLGSAASFSVLRHITEPLVAFTYDGKMIPALAESWEQLDPTTLRFKLRQGVSFSNGAPLNAAAVKYSIDKVLDPKFASWNKSYVEGLVKEVKVVDDHTVDVIEVSPTTRLLDGLTTLDVVDPSYADSGKMDTAPVGTGPYKFVSFTPRQELALERNPGYWGKAPAIAKIVVRIIPDPTTRVAALQRGEVQMINGLPFQSIERVASASDTAVAATETVRLLFLALNVRKAPLDDPRIRQALNYAVDKQRLVDTVLKSKAAVATGPCARLVQNCRTDFDGYPRDVAKAKQLLRDAGYAGQRITLTVGTGRYPNDDLLGQAIAAQLQEAGVNVKLNTIDYASLSEQLSSSGGKSPFDAWLQGWSADDLDLIGMLQSLFVSKTAAYPIGYDNPRVTKLLDQASHTVDEPTIKAALSEAQQLIWQDAPVVFLYVPTDSIGISKQLQGYQARFDEYFFFWEASLGSG